MKKKMILSLATLALTLTACGPDFKALGSIPDVDPTAEEKALAILENDTNHKLNHNTQLSLMRIQEIQGLSLKIIKNVDDNGRQVGKELVGHLETVIFSNNSCTDNSQLSDIFENSLASQQFITIPNGGRFICLEAACDNVLLVLETTRNVPMVREDGQTRTERQSSTLPVLLAKDAADGKHKPVKAQSEIFLTVNDTAAGKVACDELISTPAQTTPPVNNEVSLEARDERNERLANLSNNDSSLEARDERAAAAAAAQQSSQVVTTPVSTNNDVSLEARDERAAAAQSAKNFANDARMRAQLKRQAEADARQEAQLRTRTNTTSTIQVITPVAAPQ